MGIALAGGVVDVGAQATHPVRGALLGVGAGSAYAVYLYLTRRCGRQSPRHVVAPVCLSTAAAAVTSGAISLLTTGLPLSVPASSWGWLVALALLGQVAAWLLISKGGPHLPPNTAAALLLLQPVMAIGFALVILREWASQTLAVTRKVTADLPDTSLADGSLVTADVEREPELLWALRGGGGTLGLVTAMRVRLHRGPSLLSGRILFPWAQASAVLARLAEFVPEGPDELTVQCGFLTGPDGTPVVFVIPTWSGEDDRAGEEVLARLTALGEPLVAQLGPATGLDMLADTDAMFPFGKHVELRPRTVPALTSTVRAALLGAGDALTSPLSAVSLHSLHGAASRVPTTDTAFANRTRRGRRAGSGRTSRRSGAVLPPQRGDADGPWPEIYEQGTERKQSHAEAERTYCFRRSPPWSRAGMVTANTECGYDLVRLPRVPVEERAGFIPGTPHSREIG